MIVYPPANVYFEDPLCFFKMDRYSRELSDDFVLLVGGQAYDKLTPEFWQKKIIQIEMEMPNFLVSAGWMSFRYTLDDKFYKVLNICPYTSEWRNKALGKDLYQPIFFAVNEGFLAVNPVKRYDVVYAGHIVSPEIEDVIKTISKFNYAFINHDGHTLVTHRYASYADKMNVISESKIMVVNNLLFPNDQHWLETKAVPKWSENQALLHPPYMPQLKSRVFEAAAGKTLILCRKDPWNVIENYFTPDQDFVYYEHGQLESKIREILGNWHLYSQIAESAYNKTRAEYTTRRFFEKFILPLGG